ncbi:MAG: pitrilysin family protein [Vicinamibacterales bacterium]
MKVLVALFVLTLAVSLTAQSPSTPPVPVPPRLEVPYRLFTLDNGLTVILHQDRSVPIVALNLWYHVGSANERRGRTGFAHLFEHLMFEGSGHVAEGQFDALLESVGANNNGTTDNDRTNYYIDMPSNALELALYLESDRMGFLLDAMTPARVDGQRDVVKNERRQSYENRPYGLASLELDSMLWPAGHPYSWPTIGYMDDLTAASYDDVVAFFKRYYAPSNATLVVAGDLEFEPTRALVEKWFGDIPRGAAVEPVAAPAVELTTVTRKVITDRVRLARLYLAWLTPRQFAPGDAALDVTSSILGGGKNSRLYKRLVYDTQMAQDVSVYQASGVLGSSFQIVITAMPGVPLSTIQQAVDEELARLRRDAPEPRELQRAINQIEASFYRQMERVGSYMGKANQLNAYFAAGGGPDFFAEDLARYTSLAASDIQAAALRWLPADRRVELSVEPEARR